MCYRTRVDVGGIEARAWAFSPNETSRHGIENWSLWPIQNNRGARKNPALVSGLGSVAKKVGAHKFYAPAVAGASACITETRTLEKVRIPLGNGMVIHRNPDTPVDGIFIRRGHAFMMSGAGCPIIIASGDGQMVVANASRDSLICRDAVVGKQTRTHLSVVEAIISAFAQRGVPPSWLSMTMMFALPEAVFEHKLDTTEYRAPHNRQLASFINERWPGAVRNGKNSFFIDLECLFEEQARQVGVKDISAVNNLAELPALAHTRDGKGADRRNLIVVKRVT